jgi:hypothetical protein
MEIKGLHVVYVSSKINVVTELFIALKRPVVTGRFSPVTQLHLQSILRQLSAYRTIKKLKFTHIDVRIQRENHLLFENAHLQKWRQQAVRIPQEFRLTATQV